MTRSLRHTNVDRQSRRAMLLGLGACGCCAGVARFDPATAKPTPINRTRGCVLASARESDSVAYRARSNQEIAATAMRSSGDPAVDGAFDQALQRLARVLQVAPGFAYYDDFDGENAFATPQVYYKLEDGTVFFGERLFRRLLAADPSGAAVMWVAAHEFSHIVQFRTGLYFDLTDDAPNLRPLELHADYLAGYYLGRRKASEPRISLYEAGRQVWAAGDANFNDPNHHGAPAERLAASEAGFLAAIEDRLGLEAAIDAGFRFVKA